jgi:hypothetical protein
MRTVNQRCRNAPAKPNRSRRNPKTTASGTDAAHTIRRLLALAAAMAFDCACLSSVTSVVPVVPSARAYRLA